MAFSERIKKAMQHERDVEEFCLRQNYIVAKNGTEHTHPEFVAQLRTNNTRQSKLVRFAPDGVMLIDNNHVVYWEAKAGINMERDAYETYMAYYNMGCWVIVFIKFNDDKVYRQYIHLIKFIHSVDVVNRYMRPHPIDGDGWICPRKGRGAGENGSGTPYKEIDLNSCKLIPNFYKRQEHDPGVEK
jgi:hypothetical protein